MIKLILSTVSIRASIYLGMVGLVWAIKPLERSWYFLNSGNNSYEWDTGNVTSLATLQRSYQITTNTKD